MKTLTKRIIAFVLISVMLCGMLAGCSGSKDSTITLTVFSELANYSGEQVGWIAKMLKEKFNVVLNIIPSTDGVYETRMESGNLGDIVVWGSDGENYTRAMQAGLLYDWNEDDLVKEYGPYIYANMQAALKKNASISEKVTGKPTVYGFGHNVAGSNGDHASFFYTWDLRWDLYKELGYPEVKSLDDLVQVLADMKKLCPTDENGNETTPLLTLLKNKFQQDWYAIQDQMAEDGPFMPLYWRNGVVLTRYPYSSVRDIREFELLNSIESYR